MHLRWTVGDVTITRILESVSPVPPHALFPEASADAVARHADWLQPHFVDETGQLLLSIHGFVVESAGARILVDTCIGDKPIPGYPDLESDSSFLDDLAAAGFALESFDTVLCTHLHFDHVGWNTRREGDGFVPTFPSARYLFGREEYAHWSQMGGSEFAATLESAVQPIFDAGLADLVETDHRITPEVWLEATPGHTPGHVAVRIESRGERALITGDLTHHPVQWAELDWKMHADSDSSEAARTRRRLLAEHADQDVLVIGSHYADPCAGHLVADGQGGFRFKASTD